MLARWGTEASVPAIIELIKTEQPSELLFLPGAVKLVPDERFVEPLCERLLVLQMRHFVGNAIKELGPVAEDGLLELLVSDDTTIQREAIQLLKVVGTAKSIPALEAIDSSTDGIAKIYAKQAIDEISKRVPKK